MDNKNMENKFENLSENDIKAINGLVDFFSGITNSNMEKFKIPVEIIEDSEEKRINRIFIEAQDILNDNSSISKHMIHKCITLMAIKINELVDKVNELSKE